MRSRLWVLLAAIVLLAVVLAPVAAQTRLFDGASLLGTLGPGAAAASFSFDAATGDRIGVRALGLNGLDPILSVIGPDGAELASATSDPSTLESGDSLITLTAPAAGAYSVSVAAEPDTAGDFLLQFEQSPAGSVFPLPAGQSAPIQISAAGGTLRLRFEGSADCPTVLVAHPSGDPGFAALLSLTGEQGALLGQVTLGRDEQRLTVTPGASSSLVEITPLPGSSDGEVIFTTACATEQPACTEAPAADSAVPVAFAEGDATLAQPGGVTFYGLARQGEIAQDSPPVAYTFDGTAGDTVAVLVTAISPDFDPVLSLIGPDRAPLGLAGNTPGSLRPADALLRAVLPEDGAYSVLVGSTNSGAGVYVIRLAQETTSSSTAIVADTPIDVALAAGADGGPQRFSFDALDSCPTALTLSSSDGDSPTPVVVRKTNGEWVGELVPSQLSGASLVVAAASGAYDVMVAPADAGTLTLQVSCQMQSLACTASGGPLLISTPTPAATAATGAILRAVVSQNANLRTGDSQNYRLIQSVPQGTELDVIAVSDTGSGWFRVRLADGTEGWITPFALTIDGDVLSLPRLLPGGGSSAGQAAPTSAPAGGGGSLPADSPGSPGDGSSDGGSSGGGITPTSDPGGSGGVCGNGTCEANENPDSCYQDCGYCTDGTCNSRFEDQYSCDADCPPVCGDGDCNSSFEDAGNCSADCPGWCGDGTCNTLAGENAENCPEDFCS